MVIFNNTFICLIRSCVPFVFMREIREMLNESFKRVALEYIKLILRYIASHLFKPLAQENIEQNVNCVYSYLIVFECPARSHQAEIVGQFNLEQITFRDKK